MTNLTLRYLPTKLPVGVSEDSVHSESKSAEKTHTHTRTLNMSICQSDLRPLEEREICPSGILVGNTLVINGGVVQPACRETDLRPLLGGKQACCIGSMWEQTAAALSAVIVTQACETLQSSDVNYGWLRVQMVPWVDCYPRLSERGRERRMKSSSSCVLPS